MRPLSALAAAAVVAASAVGFISHGDSAVRPVRSFGSGEPLTNNQLSRLAPETPVFASDWCQIPHPSKAAKGGEDALVTLPLTLAVADGVGGWNEVGVDPREYSQALCRHIRQFAVDFFDFSSSNLTSALRKKSWASSLFSSSSSSNNNNNNNNNNNDENNNNNSNKYVADPKLLISQAADLNRKIQGSCTVCVASLDGLELKIANLGDSGILVVRPKSGHSPSNNNNNNNNNSNDNNNKSSPINTIELETIFRSQEQQHRFNFPFQIGTHGDPPSAAESFSVKVEAGDILVLGTDGLFDNLYDRDIISILQEQLVTQNLPSLQNPKTTAAHAIAMSAFEKSTKWGYFSPFSFNAKKAGQNYLGGKMDDITVIVAVVTSLPPRAKL